MKLKKIVKVLIGLVALLSVLAVGALIVVGDLYRRTENRNFATMRKKSVLNCQTMPLHCAIQARNRDLLTSLLRDNPKLNGVDGWNSTALIYAVVNAPEMVGILLEAKVDVQHVNEQGDDALAVALRRRNFGLAKDLLAAGSDPNRLVGLNHAKRLNRLGAALLEKDQELVAFLIAHGASRNAKDEFGYNYCERVKLHGLQKEFSDCHL